MRFPRFMQPLARDAVHPLGRGGAIKRRDASGLPGAKKRHSP